MVQCWAQDQAVITLALRDVCLHAPKGRYVVTYDGDGEIDFGMDATPVAFQKGRGRVIPDFQAFGETMKFCSSK